MNKVSKTLLAAAMITLPGIVMAHDYSTVTRVHYVQECLHANDDMNIYEGTNKCSCVIDQIAEVFDEPTFQELDAGYTYSNMTADRGKTVRNSTGLSDELKLFEATLLSSYEQCRINVQ